MNKIISFIQNEIHQYPKWWKSLSQKQKVLPLILVLAYWLSLFALDSLRSDHISLCLVLLILSYGGPFLRTHALPLLMPIFATGIIYDSMRFYADIVRREKIFVQLPYNFDMRFFGIDTAEGRLTPNEYWQKHTHWILDFICGIYYLTFIFMYMAIVVYWRFFHHKIKQLQDAMLLAWGFLWLNMIGYVTYYIFPVAPPWYVTQYGLSEPANMNALPSQAGCVRFDLVLGTHFFKEFYSKSCDVFGAVPSLHVAYPLLCLLFAFRLKSLRLFCLIFYVIMCFSAVYFNHHYVLDILWGSAYAVVIYGLLMKYKKLKNA